MFGNCPREPCRQATLLRMSIVQRPHESIKHLRPSGAFVIDRNGLGYADIGEEVDWNRGESEEEEAAADKARPGAGAKRRGAAKTGKTEDEKPKLDPAAQRAKMQRMFAAAAAKPRSRPLAADRGVDQTSTDELLAGILGNVAAAEPVVQAGSVAASRTPASARSSVFSRLPRASIGSPPRLARSVAWCIVEP